MQQLGHFGLKVQGLFAHRVFLSKTNTTCRNIRPRLIGRWCASSGAVVGAGWGFKPQGRKIWHIHRTIDAMTLTELKYIVAVAREKHFGKAADACYVSQPTLSVAIKTRGGAGRQTVRAQRGQAWPSRSWARRIVRQAQSVLEQAAAIKGLQSAAKTHWPVLSRWA